MLVHRTTTLLLVALGTLWAMILVVGGLMVLGEVGPTGGGLARAGVAAALTAVAAGQFVFLVVVGDRLFPEARRSVAGRAEALFGGLFCVGAVATVVLAAGSGAES